MPPDDTTLREALLGELDALHAFARRLDPEHADDLLQDALATAWRRRLQLRHLDRARGWVGRIVYRTFIDRRRRWVPTVVGEADVEHAASPSPDPEQQAATHDLRRRLEEALAELPADQREAVLLVDHLGLSFADAAETMGVAPGTAASRVARGRRALRLLLAQDAHEMGVTA